MEKNVEDAKQDITLDFIRDDLKRIEAQNIIDHNKIIEQLKETTTDHRSKLDDHCIRLREIEKQQAIDTYKVAAIVSAITFAIVFAVQAVWSYLTRKI